MANPHEIDNIQGVSSDPEALEVLRFYRARANQISDPAERAAFLENIEYLENNTPPKHVSSVAKPPANISSLKIVLCMVLCGLVGWVGLQGGIDILLAQTLTYAKKGFPLKTVLPFDGAFEFYYQVAFFLTLGAAGALASIGALLAMSAKLLPSLSFFRRSGPFVFFGAAISGGMGNSSRQPVLGNLMPEAQSSPSAAASHVQRWATALLSIAER